MKKIIALLLMFSLVFSLAVFAASAEESEPDIQCVPGDTITVLVSLSEEYQGIKGGSIQFDYDDSVFEYVSYRWIPKNLTIKNYGSSDMKGVFAAPAKAYNGDLFELKLKVKQDAEYSEYTINAAVQLQNESNQFTNLNFSYVVSVVEYIEIDDPTTPADFDAAVSVINMDDINENTYDAIADAVAKYSLLTSAEKEEAAEAYATLLNKVEAYNAAAGNINAASENASSVAFSAISNIFTYLDKLLEALREMIWK